MGKLRASVPVAALLLALVFSSGCTIPVLNIEIPGLPDFPGFGPTTVQDTHDIIVIKSMEAVPDTLDSGGTSQIVAYVQNVGDKTVGDETHPVVVDLYDYCEGLYTPRLVTCGPEEIQQIHGDDSGTSAGSQGYTQCSIKKILPGEIVPVIWSVCQNRAEPVKVRTVCPAEGMKMSVRYHYTTTSISTISLISLSEMQREMIERRYDTDNGYISLGQGPIKPIITVEDKQPVPVYDIMPGGPDTNADVINARTVLKLQMQNKGSGNLDSKVDVPMEGGGTRKVIGIDWDNVEILGIGDGEDLKPVTKNVKTDDETCSFMSSAWKDENNPIRFVGEASSAYHCIIDLSGLKGKVTTTTSRHVQAEIEYDYLITKSTMLTVDPKIAG